MKKILLITIILLVGFSVFALDCSVEAGLQEGAILVDDGRTKLSPIFLELSLYQNLWKFDFYATYRCEMEKIQGIYFNPTQDYYTVGAKIDFWDFTIKVEHQCYHPVNCYNWNTEYYNGGYTQISIKYSTQ